MRAAVLGSPIGHSLSPVLHRAAYAALGLQDWTYDAIEVLPEGLASFLDGLGPEWAGLSLTMPLKQAVLPLLTSASELVGITGAANTVVLRDGERVGHNTDVEGMVAALREAGVASCDRAAVIGAGATAASALAALHEL
ncbi:MAG: shikimate dehydrogenase, partial [Mycobacteriales bacterium]